MSFLGALKGEIRGRVITGNSLANPEAWWIRLMLGGRPEAPAITEATAMQIAAVWACIRNIAEDTARLPAVGIERKDDGTRNQLPQTEPAVVILNRRPNPETLPIAFREAIMVQTLAWGNGIAEIEWAGNGRGVAMWQQAPGTWRMERTKASGKIVYVIESERAGHEVTLDQDQVWHVKGLGIDGLSGVSVIKYAAQSMALSAAAERFGGSFFTNGAVPTGVLEHPAKLNDQGKRLKESWQAAHGDPSKRSVAVLEEGMKYHQIGLPPEDSQFLETRQFQIPEICRWFRMPPHKVHDLSRSTYANIEHQAIEYVSDCLLPWIIRIEQETARKFFHTGVDPNYARTIKLNVASLLRGDIESRYRGYAIGRQWGFLSVDDILELEDRNPLPGDQGNSYLVPSNMVPADKIGAKVDAEIEGAKQAGTPPAPPPSNPGENGNQNRTLLRTLLAAQTVVLSEALEHAAAIGTEKIGRHAKRPDYTAWLETFYRDHRDAIRGHVFPFAEAAASIGAAIGYPGTSANKIATGIADRAIERMKARQAAGTITTPEDQEAPARAEIEHAIGTIAGATP